MGLLFCLASYPVSCGEPGTNRLCMCNNFTENCVICILSVNSNFQVHATSLKMM